MHGLFVRDRILNVGVLVGPKAIRYRMQKALHTIDPSLKKFTCGRVGFGDQIYFGPIGPQNADVLRGCFGVHHTYQPHAITSAGLSQAYTHIAGAGLDDRTPGPDVASFQSGFDYIERGSVFDTAARVKGLQFGKEAKVRIFGKVIQLDNRCITYKRQNPGVHKGPPLSGAAFSKAALPASIY
jgi:hypothetical protein